MDSVPVCPNQPAVRPLITPRISSSSPRVMTGAGLCLFLETSAKSTYRVVTRDFLLIYCLGSSAILGVFGSDGVGFLVTEVGTLEEVPASMRQTILDSDSTRRPPCRAPAQSRESTPAFRSRSRQSVSTRSARHPFLKLLPCSARSIIKSYDANPTKAFRTPHVFFFCSGCPRIQDRLPSRSSTSEQAFAHLSELPMWAPTARLGRGT